MKQQTVIEKDVSTATKAWSVGQMVLIQQNQNRSQKEPLLVISPFTEYNKHNIQSLVAQFTQVSLTSTLCQQMCKPFKES